MSNANDNADADVTAIAIPVLSYMQAKKVATVTVRKHLVNPGKDANPMHAALKADNLTIELSLSLFKSALRVDSMNFHNCTDQAGQTQWLSLVTDQHKCHFFVLKACFWPHACFWPQIFI